MEGENTRDKSDKVGDKSPELSEQESNQAEGGGGGSGAEASSMEASSSKDTQQPSGSSAARGPAKMGMASQKKIIETLALEGHVSKLNEEAVIF